MNRDVAAYRQQVDLMESSFRDYPHTVSIETCAICNASCHFCPYSKLSRKGAVMPTELLAKTIYDLTKIPREHKFYLVLSRVNEPFLDERLLDFAYLINGKLPNASQFFITNGSILSRDKIDMLLQVRNIAFLVISLNHHVKSEYERIMRLPFDRTISNIDLLHDYYGRGEIGFPVHLSRVGNNSGDDVNFVDWCKARYPGFAVTVNPQGDWMGLTEPSPYSVPDVGCKQWYQLHILANGNDAFCCIDAEGSFGSGHNIATHTALEIYRSPERTALRIRGLSRKSVGKCRACTMLP